MDSSTSKSDSVPPGAPRSISPGSLLVVDDSKLSRLVLARHFRAQGYTVSEAEDGDQAIEKIEQKVFDLLDRLSTDTSEQGNGPGSMPLSPCQIRAK